MKVVFEFRKHKVTFDCDVISDDRDGVILLGSPMSLEQFMALCEAQLSDDKLDFEDVIDYDRCQC